MNDLSLADKDTYSNVDAYVGKYEGYAKYEKFTHYEKLKISHKKMPKI